MKASLPFPPSRLSRVLCIAVFAGLCAQGHAQPPAAPTPEPPPVPPPKYDATLPEEAQKARQAQADTYRQQALRYYRAALSQVRGAPSGEPLLYSRSVNHITGVAAAPSTDGERAWVGTRLGIKRIEKGRIVRHYTSVDGLANDAIVAIAADASGAAALVRRDDSGSPAFPTALCWWDNRSDTWRVLRYLGDNTNSYAGTPGWRVLLTPTRVVLVPPQLAGEGPPSSGNDLPPGLVFWNRADLQAGQLQETILPWSDALLLEIRRFNVYEHPQIYGAATWQDNVVLGTPTGLIWIPDAAFKLPPSPPSDATPGFLPVRPPTPTVPVFLSSAAVLDISADRDGLWAISRDHSGNTAPQLRRLTPVFSDGTLTGLQQKVLSAPSGSPAAQLLQAGATLAPGSSKEAWLLASNGYFLHWSEGQWQTRDENGVPRPDDKPLRTVFNSFGGYDNYLPFDIPALVAPSPAEIPDAVIRAWLSKPASDTRGLDRGAPYAPQRRLAWLHQRFPSYLTPPVTPTSSIWLPNFTEAQQTANFISGDPASFVRDPFTPAITWHGGTVPRPVAPGVPKPHTPQFDSVLWKIPSGDIPPWRFALQWEEQITRFVGPVPLSHAETFPLPSLSVPLHLAVTGLISRPDGLYVSTNTGILRLTGVVRAGKSAGTGAVNWLPRQTEQGTERTSFLSGPLLQAGPGQTLLVDSNRYSAQRPLLSFKENLRFVPELALPRESIVAATSRGLFTRPLRKISQEDGSAIYTQSDLLRWVPLRADGTPELSDSIVISTGTGNGGAVTTVWPDDSNRFATKVETPQNIRLTESGFPFLADSLQQTGATGTTVWFVGRVDRAGPFRYPHPGQSCRAIAGYDLTRKHWTRLLELPESDYQTPATVIEEAGQAIATFAAPDNCVWRYRASDDNWEAIAPALPSTFKPDPNRTRRIQLWTARDGDIWALFQQSVLHKAPRAKAWAVFTGPANLTDRQSDWEPPVLAAKDNGFFVGTKEGLWRFDRKTYAWAETAPETSSVPETSVSLSIQSLVADKEAVYVAATVQISGSSSDQGGCLLAWSKQARKWTMIPPTALGMNRFRSYGPLTFDGQNIIFSTEGRTFRHNTAAGTWQEEKTSPGTITLTSEKNPGVSYRHDFHKVERLDARTGQAETLLDTYTVPPSSPSASHVRILQRGTLISALKEWHGSLYLMTSAGMFRLDPATRQVQAVPVPTFPYGAFAEDERGALYYWNSENIAAVPE